MSKKCLDCAFFEKAKSYCYLTDDPVEISASSDACPDFKQRTQTVFQQITASPEVLAPNFVYRKWSVLKADFVWHSTILKGKLGNDFNTVEFKTEKQAIAATVEKLKEVE